MTPAELRLQLQRNIRKDSLSGSGVTITKMVEDTTDASGGLSRPNPYITPDSTEPPPVTDTSGVGAKIEEMRQKRRQELEGRNQTQPLPSSGMPNANAMTMQRPEVTESPLDFINAPTRALAAGLTDQEFSDKDAYLLKNPTEAIVQGLEGARDKRRAELEAQGYNQPTAPGGVPIRYDVAGKNPELGTQAIMPGAVEAVGRTLSDPTVIGTGAVGAVRGGFKMGTRAAAKGLVPTERTLAGVEPTLSNEISASINSQLKPKSALREGLENYGARKKAAKNAILNPELSPDAKDYQEFGKNVLGFTQKEAEHEALLFGKNSESARTRLAQAGGKGGDPLLKEHNAMTEKVQKGFDKGVREIGGEPLEPKQAGEFVFSSVLEGKDRILKSAELTHNQVVKTLGNMPITGAELSTLQSDVNGLKRYAAGAIQRGKGTAEGKGSGLLKNLVENFERSEKSYKQINELRERVGNLVFAPQNTLEIQPDYLKKAKDFYFKLSDALIETVGKNDRVIGGQFQGAGKAAQAGNFKEKLLESNRIIHELILDENSISRAIGNNQKAGEKIFEQVMGDSRQAQALKAILTPAQLTKLQGSYLNHLVKKGKDVFTYKASENVLANDRAFLDELFSNNPEKLAKINKIIDMGDRIGPPVLPGSAGSLALEGTIPPGTLDKILSKVSEPLGDIARAKGKQRALAELRGERVKTIAKKSPAMVQKLVKLGLTEAEINAALQTAEP